MITEISSVEALFDLLHSATDDDDESVSVLEHSLQCARLLRRQAIDDEELQVAGLVHDLGTVVEPDRPTTHATTGAAAVRPLLGAHVAALVAAHDVAKRYLVTVDTGYAARLSARSIETLELQGGPLIGAARLQFEADPWFAQCLALRRADDAAKIPGFAAGTTDDWRPIVERVARRLRHSAT